MHAYSISPIEFAGQTFGPGVFETDDANFHALAQRGPVRPATGEEIRAHFSTKSAVEAAAITPAAETATAPAQRKSRR